MSRAPVLARGRGGGEKKENQEPETRSQALCGRGDDGGEKKPEARDASPAPSCGSSRKNPGARDTCLKPLSSW